MQIDTIVFDLGGVLIDWNPEYVYRNIFPDPKERKYFFDHICTSDWNEEQDAGRPLQEATEQKVMEYPEYESAIRAFYGRWKEMLGGPMQESVRLLKHLKSTNSHQLLALTNWSHETFPYALANFEFLQWFEGIVVSGVEKMKKPEARIYQLLIERYNLQPEKTVFIDDNFRNVQAAEVSGFQSIHFTKVELLIQSLRKLGVDIYDTFDIREGKLTDNGTSKEINN